MVSRHRAGDGHIHVAALADGLVELGDLVSLGQVRVEVILAVEIRNIADLGFHCLGKQHSLLHHCLVEDRQHTRQARAHRADIGVGGILPRIGFARAEDLARRVELNVCFQVR